LADQSNITNQSRQVEITKSLAPTPAVVTPTVVTSYSGEITNAGGANAVNIQDGGNSLTVDGAVSITNAGGASAVNIQDGGNSITVDGTLTDAQLRASSIWVVEDDSVTSPIVAVLSDILVELRVISNLLNEGMNLKEDLNYLRNDEEREL